MRSIFYLGIFLTACLPSFSQQISRSLPEAHSHNDYEQNIPFWRAYYQNFGSIEADIILRNDTLFTAHDLHGISPARTFEQLYLNPIVGQTVKHGGSVYPEKQRQLQLLIDLKTSAKETLTVLIRKLDPYKQILFPRGSVKIVISGNMPEPGDFDKYPDYIFFDGRPEIQYTTAELARVGLISQGFYTYSRWNGKGILTEKEQDAIDKVVSETHRKGKKLRLWATPDHINAWKMLLNYGVDYLNTDHVEELGNYLKNRNRAEYQANDFHIPYKPTYRNNDSRSKVKNVILLIGDGMGLAQIYAGLTANRGELNLTQFLNIGFSKTAASDSYITDSAAGGTAMATGKKTRNRAIGVDSNLVAIPNLPDRLKPLGIRSGLISAGSITDATPAAFYAHQPDRSFETDIAGDFLTSPVEILIGGGIDHFRKSKAIDTLQSRGFRTSAKWEDLATLKAPFILLDDSKTGSVLKGRGNFLTEAFNKTITELNTPKTGMFVMAEGAQIDYGGHANEVAYVASEMQDFDKLIGDAMRFADANGETLVIVTADHETGGLTLLDGNLKTGYVDGHFSTNDHTAVMVPVFAYGPHSLDFRGTFENTAIFEKIYNILSLYNKDQSKVKPVKR
ncbi:alkaline phosphatase [Dyadobacter luteus]|jgi:alkaline phosphatase|uniref:Alkaline phosphatase n=1 Tax=Dyadobacter luteus TaxID=2259619 RepID=A0A3D8YE24_9BACT|nr:alkaline phosphatase [Dyadobacter luteus]REA62756.1 alkaline phosphatase [Dyadobacter luteus]